MKKKLLFALSILVLVTACTTDPYTGQKKVSSTAKGAVIGTAGGAAVGAIAGGKKGALIGAGAGAVVGGGVGGYMDLQAKALREELQGTGVSVVQEGDQIVLVMPGNITFSTNAYAVKDSFKPTLNSVAKVIKKYSKTFVEITGHTDSTGNAATNNTLSFNRANAVGNYLKTQGVSANRMLIEGKGSRDPIASNSTATGREKNRRVEITLINNQ